MTATLTLPDISTPLVDTRPGIKSSLWVMIHHPVYRTKIIRVESTLCSDYGLRLLLNENGIRREDGWELMDWNAGEPEGFLTEEEQEIIRVESILPSAYGCAGEPEEYLTEEDEEFLDYQELLDYVLAA